MRYEANGQAVHLVASGHHLPWTFASSRDLPVSLLNKLLLF